jgi:hypothetical protein
MKSAFASKSIYLNVIALVLAVFALPELNSVVPEAWLPIIGAVVAVLNLVLRFIGGSVSTLQVRS